MLFHRIEVEACALLHRRVVDGGLGKFCHLLLHEREAPELVCVEVLSRKERLARHEWHSLSPRSASLQSHIVQVQGAGGLETDGEEAERGNALQVELAVTRRGSDFGQGDANRVGSRGKHNRSLKTVFVFIVVRSVGYLDNDPQRLGACEPHVGDQTVESRPVGRGQRQ
jgi:hypothetical protein